ncbi:ribosomal protein L11 methyltransferase isoform X1 [Rhodamnia argentea]|uniref:ETFB lysine methyltransferase n=1 Tax=Rhodamnia argentea TaxID=178133 RepID=A0A8B8MPM2_9MYRT|nr:ribosomal protein L11 methyltransferase isoform X1 [Rhodamnia argentea]
MSVVSRFVKHLVSSSPRLLLRPPPSPSPPPYCPSALSVTQTTGIPDLVAATFSFSTAFSSPSLSSSDGPAVEPSSPSYLSVRIRCPKDVADVLSEALLCFGASSASMDEEDGSESPDEISINSIFLPSEDVDASVSNAADSIGLKDVPVYDIEVCEQEDWVTKTQESFHPVEVTEGLWIVPEWKTPPIIEATNIILNPGLAFGTGEHPTTRLCLLLLHDLIKGGEHLLDYGTGSGILAIAALKLGAAAAVGFDVDPQAISSARHNAALNNIGSDKMQLELVPSKLCPQTTNEGIDKDPGQTLDKQGLISATEKYDVVVANILLNPLLEWADHIVSYAKPGATVAVSGILSDQLPLIRSRYSRFLEDILVSELDDWACLSGRKR